MKKRYPRLKILISLQGAGFADARPENRKVFVVSCVDVFLRGNFAPGIHESGIFDGFDIDWEYPHAKASAFEENPQQPGTVAGGGRRAVVPGISIGNGFPHEKRSSVDCPGRYS